MHETLFNNSLDSNITVSLENFPERPSRIPKNNDLKVVKFDVLKSDKTSNKLISQRSLSNILG